MPTLFQHLAAHVRLTLAFGAGAVVAAAWPGGIDPVTRALIGWNVGTWLYLAVVAWKIEHADHAHVRRVAEAQAESIAIVLLLVITGAIASLAGTALLLSDAREASAAHVVAHVALAFATVIGSWLLVPTLFSLAYAARYFHGKNDGGLVFPDGKDLLPHYADFLYFAFTIAVASQTSDVAVIGTPMRRLVLLQSVLSFGFNTAVLAFTINLAAQML